MIETCRITWHPPLTAITGRESTVDLDLPISVGDLLRRLYRDLPDLSNYTHLDPDNRAVIGLMVLRGDSLLKPSDMVEPGGSVEILSAIDGG